ncbi:S41 family peptidase [Pedobacter steynii]
MQEKRHLKQIREVLDSLSDCKILVFDISDNPGGDGASSAFINQFLYRAKDYQTLLQKKCNNEKDWHQSEVIFDYSGGPIFFDVPIYIITSNKTFSAAEYFAFTAKKMKRAIILGETTAGAGNPGTSTGIALANSDIVFWMFIPNCQIRTSDGDFIEGKGVKPDVKFEGKNLVFEALEYIGLRHN